MDQVNIYDTHGNLLYASKAETMRKAVEEAVGVGAELDGADLTGADLTGATLTDANLTGANLAWANLAGAYLTGADLYRADLTGAYLAWATLTGADLTGAIGIANGGTDSRGHRWVAVQHDDGPRISAGCRWYTLAEAHKHWDGEHEDGEAVGIECRARLALLETLAKGWIK